MSYEDDLKPRVPMVDPYWTRIGRSGKTFTVAAYVLRFARELPGWHRGAKVRSRSK